MPLEDHQTSTMVEVGGGKEDKEGRGTSFKSEKHKYLFRGAYIRWPVGRYLFYICRKSSVRLFSPASVPFLTTWSTSLQPIKNGHLFRRTRS